jgi:hypothetical protein
MPPPPLIRGEFEKGEEQKEENEKEKRGRTKDKGKIEV